MKKYLIFYFVIFSITIFAKPSTEEILKKMEFNSELKTDGTAKVTITQKTVGQGMKKMESIYYRRDSDDSFLIVMTSPEVEKGNGYLRVGDNFWMYRRNTRTFQHVNRDESIAGSNSSGEDFEYRKMSEMYKGKKDSNGNELIEDGKLGNMPCYIITLKNKVDDVSFPVKKLWVRKDLFLPLKEENYSLSEKLMQTNYYLKYTKIQGKYLWIKGIFIDEFEKGNKTVVEINNISPKEIEDYVFTKAYLENLSK